jgi:arsenate reductase-like glutaredoxin family protein
MLAQINVLKTHIINYSKTKEIYVTYRKSGYSKKYLEEHEADIIIHKASKKAFDELGVKKLPTIKSLQVEFAELMSTKKTTYADLKRVRDELKELSVHKANYEELRDLEERENRKEKERGRE